MTTITNYTTYDLAYYYADLCYIAFLTDEEQSRLIAATSPAAPRLDIPARNRLIEAHLGLAKRIAIETCPPTAYQKLPDIIGEVNTWPWSGQATTMMCRQGATCAPTSSPTRKKPSSEPWALKNSFASQTMSSLAPAPKALCTRSTRCSPLASI